jgi:hypothetical protein
MPPGFGRQVSRNAEPANKTITTTNHNIPAKPEALLPACPLRGLILALPGGPVLRGSSCSAEAFLQILDRPL